MAVQTIPISELRQYLCGAVGTCCAPLARGDHPLGLALPTRPRYPDEGGASTLGDHHPQGSSGRGHLAAP
jgi:hypothetical protein